MRMMLRHHLLYSPLTFLLALLFHFWKETCY
uniref:Uncharacterized protein n=1 Tax=Rhizophora mucronata TaxID=61149 RepID=A0A2P2Q6D1_RHIMU